MFQNTTAMQSAGRALGLGVIGGLRIATAVAITSRGASRGAISIPPGKPFDLLNSRRTATVWTLFNMPGEMIADLLPFTPSRTMPASLLGRVVTGGILGAATARGSSLPPVAGAVLGGTGAWCGTFAGYTARSLAGKRTGLPDPVFGLLEDAIAVTSGVLVVRRPWFGYVLGACAAAIVATLLDDSTA